MISLQTDITLDQYIQAMCLENDLNYDNTRSLFVSPHRYTKVCNDPARATMAELLELAKRLDVRPIYLFSEFKLASNSLSSLELQLLKAADKKTRRKKAV